MGVSEQDTAVYVCEVRGSKIQLYMGVREQDTVVYVCEGPRYSYIFV